MSVFRFKQFEVDQQACAMRINTDGVLLAAIAGHTAPKQILDIGTGTGVMALMLAQRFSQAQVYAIDIESDAAQTAEKNFRQSPFHARLSAEAVSIENYVSNKKFDLIVSNPPYFVGDLPSVAEKKGIARHATPLFFDILMQKVGSLLHPDGVFWFILPLKQAQGLVQRAAQQNFSVTKYIYLHSDSSKPPFRAIVALQRCPESSAEEHFYIYESEKVYTAAYKTLLKDFFLGY